MTRVGVGWEGPGRATDPWRAPSVRLLRIRLRMRATVR